MGGGIGGDGCAPAGRSFRSHAWLGYHKVEIPLVPQSLHVAFGFLASRVDSGVQSAGAVRIRYSPLWRSPVQVHVQDWVVVFVGAPVVRPEIFVPRVSHAESSDAELHAGRQLAPVGADERMLAHLKGCWLTREVTEVVG